MAVAIAALALLTGCGSASKGSSDIKGAPTQASSKLAERVSAACYALMPSPAAGMGLNVAVNERIQRAIRDCVEASGAEFQPWALNLGDQRTLEADDNVGGVDAAWHVPPNPKAAAAGLGMVGPLVPMFSDPQEALFDRPAPNPAYVKVFDRCSNEQAQAEGPTTDIWDPSMMEELNGGMAQIGAKTQKLDGFAELRALYQACIAGKNFKFSDPATLLDLAKENYGTMPGEEAIAFERGAAVADSECRQPLYDRFIELSASEWTSWLDKHDADIHTVEAQFADLEQIAQASVKG
jgi:hypothetical protein